MQPSPLDGYILVSLKTLASSPSYVVTNAMT